MKPETIITTLTYLVVAAAALAAWVYVVRPLIP